MELKLGDTYLRSQQLTQLRLEINSLSTNGSLSQEQFEILLKGERFSNLLFQLFANGEEEVLPQDQLMKKLRTWTECSFPESDLERRVQEDLVDLFESVTYLVCKDEDLVQETFYEVISSKGLDRKLFRAIKGEPQIGHDNGVDVDMVMGTFLMMTCRDNEGRNKGEEFITRLVKYFKENLGPDSSTFTFEQFRKIIPCKDAFFAKRIFDVFDSDSSGKVSLAEFIEAMQRFSGNDHDKKIEFLFKVYDADNDEMLCEDEYRNVLQACMRENKMEFSKEEIECLTSAIFQDGVQEGKTALTFDDFRAQMLREEGLLENLSLLINKWVVPEKEGKVVKPSLSSKIKNSKMCQYFSWDYWTQNLSLILTILSILGVNAALFIHRAHQFKDFSMLSGLTPNPFYLLSRACGRTLLFNSVIILLLVLRYTITLLRKFGLATILPLDHNIYIHKIVGILIFLQATLHTVMHICNFAINVQPDPAKFVQLTADYWTEPAAGYQLPEGCYIYSAGSPEADQYCDPSSFEVPDGLTLNVTLTFCQGCPDGSMYTYHDWLTTMKPGVFGLVPGCANPTGIALMVVLLVMVVCALPVVRRSGHFEVFYVTHLLYLPYFILLIFHAPTYWQWILGPAIIWVGEMLYRLMAIFFGHGKTSITTGVLLPSKVTNLVIQRPSGFRFSPGDWVFVKIPAVAGSEWHPFTISSAPEVEGTFTLHIRGVGGWTNKLYEFFEKEYNRKKEGVEIKPSRIGSIYGSVKNRLNTVRKKIVPKNEEKDTFTSIANNYHSVKDKERQRRRMERRVQGLERIKMDMEENGNMNHEGVEELSGEEQRCLAPVRYLSTRQRFVRYSLTGEENGVVNNGFTISEDDIAENDVENQIKTVGRHATPEKPLTIYVDGPFGSPSSNIYRAEHAVLIGTGIGVTPFASILQSIMHRYWAIKHTCPSCHTQWSDSLERSMFKLKKVDFFWINRDQKSFEWFVTLLSQLEKEQAVKDGNMDRFLDMHMYVTSALQKTDMKAVSLQIALDIVHRKKDRDLITGLKSRTNAGRPNFDKIFTQLRDQKKGEITVFYCGNPMLAKNVRTKCRRFGFNFRKEVF